MVGVIWYRFVRYSGTDWSATLVPIRPLLWYRLERCAGTDSSATVVPIRRYYHDMTEATLDGVIVHVNAAIGKESFEGFSVIQDVIDCSMYHRSILGTRFTDLLQSVHDPVYYSLAPPLPERQPCSRTCIVFTL